MIGEAAVHVKSQTSIAIEPPTHMTDAPIAASHPQSRIATLFAFQISSVCMVAVSVLRVCVLGSGDDTHPENQRWISSRATSTSTCSPSKICYSHETPFIPI